MPKKINVAEDIVPIGQFKTHASEEIRRLHETGRPIVITQNGRPTAVLITPGEFEDLGYTAFVKAKIQAGIDSEKTGKSMTTEELREHLDRRLARWTAQAPAKARRPPARKHISARPARAAGKTAR